MDDMQYDAAFDSFDEKLSKANVNWLWDAKLPDCSIILSDEDEGEAVASQHARVSGAAVTTPARDKDDIISSPHLRTPRRKLPDIPFSACNESPISQCVYASSTPFHGQRIMSISSVGSDPNRVGYFGNETFDKNFTPNASLRAIVSDVPTNHNVHNGHNAGALQNVTFDANPTRIVPDISASSIILGSRSIGAPQNGTFDGNPSRIVPNISASSIVHSSQSVSAPQNVTFDANPSRIGNHTFAKDSIHMHDTPMIIDNDHAFENMTVDDDAKDSVDTRHSDKEAVSDMESCAKSESSEDSSTKQQERKPLKSIPQPKAGSAIPRKNDAKKTSKIGMPRMNAAAISRIQARSPQNRPGSADSESKSRIFKKPIGGRRSLLPASTAVSKLPASAKSRKPSTLTSQEAKPKLESSIAPTKRKAQESPKRLGREPKILGKPASVSATSTSLPVATPRTLHKTTGLKGPSTFTRSCRKGTGIATTTRVSSAKHAQKQQTDAKKQILPIPTEGNLRPTAKEKRLPPKQDQCNVALAILLDYAVNKLNGLSAPQLSRHVDQLKNVIEEVGKDRTRILAENDELRISLQAEQEKVHEYVSEVQQYKDSLQEHRQLNENLQSQLKNTHAEYEQKISALEKEKQDVKMECNARITETQEQSENDCQRLKDEMEMTVRTQVEELMKPYLSARSEVESMTAVLEMKNDTIRKLEAKCVTIKSQRDDMQVLTQRVEQLTQKNEDLSTQLQDKTEENRLLLTECGKLQQSFSEERSAASKLRQHNEELLYRIDSASPSPSPFNPVFTTSPANDAYPDVFSTPRDRSSRKDNLQKPRLFSYQSDDDTRETDNAI